MCYGGGCAHPSTVFSAALDTALDRLSRDAQLIRAQAEHLAKATRGAVADLEDMEDAAVRAVAGFADVLEGSGSGSGSGSGTGTAAGAAAAFRSAVSSARAEGTA